MISLIPLPYKIALGLFGALLIALASFGVGWRAHSWKANSEKLEEVSKAEAARDKAQSLLDAKASELEATKALLDEKIVESHSTIREIYRDVPAPPAFCAAPDAARRLLIDAGATGSSTSAAKPAIPVSSSSSPS